MSTTSDAPLGYPICANFPPLYAENAGNPEGVTSIVDEILEIEKLYVEKLNLTINNYVEPSRFMGDQIKFVFGNIEEIKQFHQENFYPELKRCNKDVIRIAKCFSKNIEAGNFYLYVVYAVNMQRSQEEMNKPTLKSLFEDCQNKTEEKFGLRSLLAEPFQRLFKYQNLIDSLLKKAESNENVMEIATTLKAKQDIKKLLNTTNKSMALNEVVDSKINLMNQGNFLTQNEFNIFDRNYKRKYKGKIFVFQHCVVCTERISTSKLLFKAYFPKDTSHIECINENKFLVYEQNNYKIEINGETTVIHETVQQIRQVLKETENRNSKMNLWTFFKNMESNLRAQRSSLKSGEKRGSKSNDYNVEQQFTELTKNFDKFFEENPNEVQTSAEIIVEMLTNERNYVRQLSMGMRTYLNHNPINLSETIKGKIVKIFGNFQQIRNFHENTFCLKLSECKNDVTKLANMFINLTQEGLFSNYILYAMNHNNTQSIRNMGLYREIFSFRQKIAGDSHQVEYYLFLPFQHFIKYYWFMDRIIESPNVVNQSAMVDTCSEALKNIESIIKEILVRGKQH